MLHKQKRSKDNVEMIAQKKKKFIDKIDANKVLLQTRTFK